MMKPFHLIIVFFATFAFANADTPGLGSGNKSAEQQSSEKPANPQRINAPALSTPKQTFEVGSPSSEATAEVDNQTAREPESQTQQPRENTITTDGIQGSENTKEAKEKKGFFSRVGAKIKAKATALFSKLKKFDDVTAAIILWLFLGGFGVHRVVMGGNGILILWYFLTCGGFFGILPIIDLVKLLTDPEAVRNNDNFGFGAYN